MPPSESPSEESTIDMEKFRVDMDREVKVLALSSGQQEAWDSEIDRIGEMVADACISLKTEDRLAKVTVWITVENVINANRKLLEGLDIEASIWRAAAMNLANR
ncbi:MAG: hypothetical protein AAB606_03045 [Patescibacteria group bacterium]